MARMFVKEVITFASVGADGNVSLDLPNCDVYSLRVDLLWAVTALDKSGYATCLIKTLFENADGSTFTEDTTLRKRFQRLFNSAGVPANTAGTLGGQAFYISDPRGLYKDIPNLGNLARPRRMRFTLNLVESRRVAPTIADDAALFVGTALAVCE